MTNGVAAYTTARATARPVSSRASGGKRAPEPLALVRDDVADRVVDRQVGAPAGELVDRGRVRLATAQLLEAHVVGILVRHKLDLGLRAGLLDDAPRQLDDRDLRRGA